MNVSPAVIADGIVTLGAAPETMTGVLVASLTQVLLTNSRMLYVPCVTGANSFSVS